MTGGLNRLGAGKDGLSGGELRTGGNAALLGFARLSEVALRLEEDLLGLFGRYAEGGLGLLQEGEVRLAIFQRTAEGQCLGQLEGRCLAGLGQERRERIGGQSGLRARGEGFGLGFAEVALTAAVTLFLAFGGSTGIGRAPHQAFGILLLQGLTPLAGGGQTILRGCALDVQRA